MQIIDSLPKWRRAQQGMPPEQKIFFVPTMGALHQGHAQLIKVARTRAMAQDPCGFVCVSIFVNEQQFANAREFACYPQRQQEDLQLCQSLQVDALFLPSSQELRNDKPSKLVCGVPELTRNLCGPTRPNYFSGVISILLKFCFYVRPYAVLMGKKDYQQYRVVQQMLWDLALNIQVVGVATVREENGLALSSRNEGLSVDGRRAATLIYRALCLGKKMIAEKPCDCERLCEIMKDMIESDRLNQVEYVQIVDAQDLSLLKKVANQQSNCDAPTKDFTEKSGILLAVAVHVEGIRLIDNLQCLEYVAYADHAINVD